MFFRDYTAKTSDAPVLVDLYCERTAPGFWNEPINALSNLAFIIAAALAWRLMSRRGNSDVWEKIAIMLGGLIGCGSFVFHTFATDWAQIADIIPIWSFVLFYTLLTIYRLTGENLKSTLYFVLLITGGAGLCLWAFGEILASVFSEQTRLPGSAPDSLSNNSFNGSLSYAPAMAVLAFFTVLAHCKAHPVRTYLSIATMLFTFALFFRTIDLVHCEITNGVGTHVLWHLLNGLMIGVLLKAMIEKMPPKSVSGKSVSD